MRISDWSSDVCSSDLILKQYLAQPRDVMFLLQSRPDIARHGDMEARLPARAVVRHRPEMVRPEAARARKSVVSGKSVSVRDDLGDRSRIKKKIKQPNQRQSNYNILVSSTSETI